MRLTRVTEVALVGAAALVAAALFTWPLLLDPGGALPAPTDSKYNAWVLGWVADRTRAGLLHVWDAPAFYPYRNTLAFAEPLLAIAVPLAPVYWLTGNAVLLHNVAVWASFVVAATGGFVLGRELTGSRAAGVVCGSIAAFVPFRAAHLSHVQVLGGAWLWWVMWSLHVYFREPSLAAALRAAVLFVLLGLSSLYWAYIGAVAVLVGAGLEGYRRRPPAKTWTLHGAAAAVVLVLAFVPVGWRMHSLTRPESPVSTVDVASYNADLASYAWAPQPSLVWGGVLPHGTGEADLFPGATALVCAAAALFLRGARVADTRVWTLAYMGIAALGVLFSLGESVTLNGRVMFENPLMPWLWRHVPGFAQLRTVSRFALLVQLAVSVLAALGVAAWLRRRRPNPRLRQATAAILGGLAFVEGLSVPVGVYGFSPYGDPGGRRVAHALSQRPGGAVVELPLDHWAQPDPTMIYQVRALVHGHPIAQGVSRYAPPLDAMLSDVDSPLTRVDRIPEAPAFLRALGVRLVVIHEDLYDDRTLGGRIRSAFISAAGGAAAEFPGISIIDLGEAVEPRDDAAVPEVDAAHVTVASSSAGAERMLDGDRETRWQTAQPQGPGDGFDLALAAPTAVAGLRLYMGATRLSEYPRSLTIEVAQPDGSLHQVVSKDALPALGRSLRRDPLNPAIELRWPPRVTARIRVRQNGRSDRWRWSVGELRVLTPRTR